MLIFFMNINRMFRTCVKIKENPPQNGILAFFGVVSRETSCFAYFLDLPSHKF